MTTITATPDTATASVQLSITYNSAVTRVLRNDANGVAEVRTLTGQLPTGASGTLILSDYEASAGLNAYTAYVDEYVTRTNLVTNPSFETSAAIGKAAVVTLSQSTYAPALVVGANALNIVIGASATTNTYIYQDVAITAGDWVAFTGSMRWSGGSRYYVQQIRWLDVGGAYTGTPSYGSTTYGWNYHQRDTVSGLAPALATKARLMYYFFDDSASLVAPTSGTQYMTDAWHAATGATQAAAEALTSVYFDGSLTDTADLDYVWTGTAHGSTSTRTEHVHQVAANASLVLDKPWLMVPVMPNYALQAESITGYGSERQSSSTVHAVIGRSDPLIAFGPLGTRTGSLEVFCDSLQDARDLETVFTRGETVMLKQNVPGMDMYFLGSSTGIAPYSVQGEDLTRYALTVSYTEIKRPIAPLAGALGWDFNALAAVYASFDEVTAKFATFDDLTIRNEI